MTRVVTKLAPMMTTLLPAVRPASPEAGATMIFASVNGHAQAAIVRVGRQEAAASAH